MYPEIHDTKTRVFTRKKSYKQVFLVDGNLKTEQALHKSNAKHKTLYNDKVELSRKTKSLTFKIQLSSRHFA